MLPGSSHYDLHIAVVYHYEKDLIQVSFYHVHDHGSFITNLPSAGSLHDSWHAQGYNKNDVCIIWYPLPPLLLFQVVYCTMGGVGGAGLCMRERENLLLLYGVRKRLNFIICFRLTSYQ